MMYNNKKQTVYIRIYIEMTIQSMKRVKRYKLSGYTGLICMIKEKTYIFIIHL